MVQQTQLPSNVHVSQHPCLLAKLSQLRSKDASAKEVKSLIHEISLIVGCEALAHAVTATPRPTAETPLGFSYQTTTLSPETISLVPILRSGLGMVEAISTLLPNPVPIHHLGLYREPISLEPVEYYNNLPDHVSSSSTSSQNRLAIILDPVIATGGTCAAAIQTLREWGAHRILVLGVVGAVAGVVRAAEEWPAGVDIWLAGVDQELTDKGMLKPGLGDVGDRLFLTIGK
ncbi:uracil phosphoribosyltransferase-domain-containing protein [Podospora didyma]|uniref:uracil phosphoribosyltransferase n=1 Tax=Podospora didyma TaxID=330526 RepID=A0AAE0KGL4_9PEZI|nr:uracil phosphoribosyltransferase-domain-containing protein [Podospora didyma]